MTYFELTARFWIGVFAAGVLLPLLALVLYETKQAVHGLTRRDGSMSRPSLPPSQPSGPAPSHPGY